MRPPIDQLDYIGAAVLSLFSILLLGAVIAVLWNYAGPLRDARRREGRGLLLRHIVLISVAEVGFMATMLVAQFDIMGLTETPRPLRLLLYTVFAGLKLLAVVTIARYGRRRVRSLPEQAAPSGRRPQ